MNYFPQPQNIVPLDFSNCPMRGQRELSANSSNWFEGIISFIFKSIPRQCYQHHIYIESSAWDKTNQPINALTPDPRTHFTSTDHNGRFIMVKFITFKVRPSAICLRSWFSHNSRKVVDPLRAFVVIGSKTLDPSSNRILGIFNYTEELKENKECIFYINTDEYFHKIYIQQLDKSFDRNYTLCIAQLEIHGLIQDVSNRN